MKPPQTLSVLVVDFRIHAKHVADFAQAIAHNASASLAAELGCLRFDVCRDPQDDTVFFLYEIYDDDGAIAAHLRSPHFLAMNAQVADWVISKNVRQLQLPGQRAEEGAA